MSTRQHPGVLALMVRRRQHEVTSIQHLSGEGLGERSAIGRQFSHLKSEQGGIVQGLVVCLACSINSIMSW